MAAWELFFVALVLLVAVLLVLTHLSTQVFQSALDSTSTDSAAEQHQPSATSATEQPPVSTADTRAETAASRPSSTEETETPTTQTEAMPALSTPGLWANVVLTQGLFGLLLLGAAWYTGVPAAAFGVAADHDLAAGVATGLGVGVVFFVLSELSTCAVGRTGTEPPTALREALAAETPGGWAVLLLVVLPVIAVFEELLFRGAMIGVLSVGFDAPVWLLAVGSSVAFGLGHSAQGRLGIFVTGLLGLGLAAVFIWTGSLLVVIVAHYIINALEFAVHERS